MSDNIGIMIETAAGSIGATVTVNKAAYREALDMLEAGLRENDRKKVEEATGRLTNFAPILMARVEELEKRLDDAERAFDRATTATQDRVAEWERRATVIAEFADQLKRSFT